MSEPQLERSVLESKEREELFAIANALGTRPTSRARKADLVDQILQATGVEPTTPAPERPRRTRTRRTEAPAQLSIDSGAAAEEPAGGGAAERPAAAERPTAAGRPAAAGRAAAGRPATAAAEPAGAPEEPAEPAAAGAPTSERPEQPEPSAQQPQPQQAQPQQPEPSAPGGRPARSARAADGRQARGADSGTAAARQDRGTDRGTDRVTDGSATDSRQGRGGGAANGHQAGGGNGRPASAAPPQAGVNGTGASLRRNTQGGGEATAGEGAGAATGGNNADESRQDDGGSRRSRRRRGRDRSDRPGDLAGQQPEQPYAGEPSEVEGLLDLREEGYGFLRATGYTPGPDDVYVSISQVRRFALRRGDRVRGACRPAGGNEKYPALVRVDQVSGLGPDEARERPRFEALTPLFPDRRLTLERPGEPGNLAARIIDLVAPIGRGQRGMVVSPPKAGKTTVLKQIARSIEAGNPDVELVVLLVDERPEEVTDMRRSINGEVVASTFDHPAEEHCQVAELTLERAKRMVELGKDVVIVLDGITRLARAYNQALPGTGRIMSGGIDTGALYPPKKFFGAARNVEEGGSLTIIATALVDTGSRMDEVIFEEFKGTGNMELRLDRRLAERRIYPAIDIDASSTRHEELLLDRGDLQQVWKLRRALGALASESGPAAATELLLERLRASRSNEEFLAELSRNAVPGV